MTVIASGPFLLVTVSMAVSVEMMPTMSRDWV
jgi:hypothetical protein